MDCEHGRLLEFLTMSNKSVEFVWWVVLEKWQARWGNLKNKQHTVYAPISCFITHRYKDFSYVQRYTQFQWSFTFSPPWSTSRGMTSWIGRTKTFPSAPRSTAVLLAASVPTFSSSTRTFFHMCLGRRSSCRRTMSPARTFPDRDILSCSDPSQCEPKIAIPSS